MWLRLRCSSKLNPKFEPGGDQNKWDPHAMVTMKLCVAGTHDPQKIRSTSYTRQFYNQSISMRSREIAPEKGPAKATWGLGGNANLKNRDYCRYTLNPKVLLRFLLARQCSVERAFEMLSSVLAWRQQTLSILRGFQVVSGLLESQFWSCFVACLNN